jgi:hypothetical protein
VSVTNDDAWLDHINGKAHHKQLGYSMRLKPETEDQVTMRHVAAVIMVCVSNQNIGCLV